MRVLSKIASPALVARKTGASSRIVPEASGGRPPRPTGVKEPRVHSAQVSFERVVIDRMGRQSFHTARDIKRRCNDAYIAR